MRSPQVATRVLLSPTERALAEKLKDEAFVSGLPEQKGADVLIYTRQGLIGLQRKEVPNDFLLSFTDGRMAQATALMVKSCKFTRIIGEGRFRYWPDGRVVTGQIDQKTRKPVASRFTRGHVRGMIFDLEFVRGIIVDWTDDLDDTVRYIRSLPDFIEREKHFGLYTRPSAQGTWVVPSAKDIQLWLLQSFTGIGPAVADRIVQKFGGVPLRWTCTENELSSIRGITKQMAATMMSSLPGPKQQSSFASRVETMRRRIAGE